MTKSNTIVIKLGSSSLVDEVTREPKLSTMTQIVEIVSCLKRLGHKVVIVSSGGIAVGLDAMNLKKKPSQLSEIQAIAAIGQGKLIGRWEMLFRQYNEQIAQILLTRKDIFGWTQFKNAQNTINALLKMGVVPIVNENDTLSVSEIKFGDNDTLSAITSALVNADYLFLLTDVDCLYTDNPKVNKDAKPILTVFDMHEDSISKVLDTCPSLSDSGSNIGTGGMRTKITAADLATNVGIHTIIMSSQTPANILKIIEYMETSNLKVDGGVCSNNDLELKNLIAHDVPLHTKFIANENSETYLKNREFWILHGLVTKGSIIIDKNSYKDLLRKKEKCKGLLPISIIDTEDQFHELECVELKVGERLPNGKVNRKAGLKVVGRARCNYTSYEIKDVYKRQLVYFSF